MPNSDWLRSLRFGRLVEESFRIVPEFVETLRATKVVGLPVVLDGAGGGFWINGHAADWIYEYRFSGDVFWIVLLKLWMHHHYLIFRSTYIFLRIMPSSPLVRFELARDY